MKPYPYYRLVTKEFRAIAEALLSASGVSFAMRNRNGLFISFLAVGAMGKILGESPLRRFKYGEEYDVFLESPHGIPITSVRLRAVTTTRAGKLRQETFRVPYSYVRKDVSVRIRMSSEARARVDTSLAGAFR